MVFSKETPPPLFLTRQTVAFLSATYELSLFFHAPIFSQRDIFGPIRHAPNLLDNPVFFFAFARFALWFIFLVAIASLAEPDTTLSIVIS
jgi:hypothetical protein